MSEVLFEEISTITTSLPTLPDPDAPVNPVVLSLEELSTITTSLPTPPDPGAPVNPVVLSLEELLNDHSVIAQKEATDKEALLLFFDRSIDSMRPKLLEWAKAGLPATFVIDTIEINPASRCSDGVVRDFLGYIQFVTEMQLPDLLMLTQNKLANINILYSFSGNKLTLHCSTTTA